MMLLSEDEVRAYDFSSHALVIPPELADSLIGEPIMIPCCNPDWDRETNYCSICKNTEMKESGFFKTLGGDPTKSGYILLANGNKVYKTEHQPTGSKLRYRKINSLGYGDVWEVIPNE